MATVEEKAADLLKGPIESMGCVLWGIQFLHAGRHSTLRVYIDRDGGVTVDDCADVSEQIGRILDVEEVIPYEYRLEVSSPGMDRLFFSFEQLSKRAAARLPSSSRRRSTARGSSRQSLRAQRTERADRGSSSPSRTELTSSALTLT